MKKLSLFTFLLLSILSIDLYSQQDPHYTQYTYNMNIVNPAYAGSRGTLSISALYRTQWVGLGWFTRDSNICYSCTSGKEFRDWAFR